jgi:hypothetical protein
MLQKHHSYLLKANVNSLHLKQQSFIHRSSHIDCFENSNFTCLIYIKFNCLSSQLNKLPMVYHYILLFRQHKKLLTKQQNLMLLLANQCTTGKYSYFSVQQVSTVISVYNM